MNRKLFVDASRREPVLNQAKKLAGRVKNISTIINQMHQKMREGNLVFELANKKVHNYYSFEKNIMLIKKQE